MRQQFSDAIAQFEGALQSLVEGNPLIALLALAILLVVTAFAMWVVRGLFRRLDRRVASWEGTRLKAFRWQSQEILAADDVTQVARSTVSLTRIAVYVLVILTMLQFVFLIIPATRTMGQGILAWAGGVLGGMGTALLAFIPSLGFLIILFFITRWAVRVLGLAFNGLENEKIRVTGFDPDWARPTFRLLRGVAWAFAVVLAFPYLPGSGSPAFQGVSIFFGVLLSLGGTGAVANVISGTVLTYMNAFKIGDRVRIADAVGDVVERTVFVTRVRTPKNVDITIPNAMVMANHIINYSARAQKGGVLLHTTVTIGYDVPWATVHQLLISAARKTEGIDDDPEPFVLQTSLDDFYPAYEINASTRQPKRMTTIYSDLHRNIQDEFHAGGVEIASPHLRAIRDGNTANIPEDHLPKDYKPGAFRLFPLGGLKPTGES